MDPNHPNQSDNNTGANRQAISSTPATPTSDNAGAQPTGPSMAPQATEAIEPVEPIAASQPTESAATTETAPTPTATPILPAEPQPQPSTPGIIASTSTIATPVETGDIVLTPDGPKPHNKRPFIIGGVILAVVLIITGAMLVVTGGLFGKRYSAEEVKEKWSSYTAILEQGPAEAEYAWGSWWIEYAGNFSYLDEEQATYIEQLKISYNDFTATLKSSPVKLEGDAKEALDTNTVLFDAATQFLRANIIAKLAYSTYDSEGYDVAIAKIDAEYPDASSNDLAKQLFASTRTYLKAALDIYKAEQENRCLYEEEELSETCIRTVSENMAKADQLSDQLDEASSSMSASYENLISGLEVCTDTLNGALL